MPDEEYDTEQLETLRNMYIATNPYRPIQTRTRLPRLQHHQSLHFPLTRTPNILCPKCMPLTMLRRNITQYFKFLRITTVARTSDPTFSDHMNITLTNTTYASPDAFRFKMTEIIGPSFIREINVFSTDIISITLTDARRHIHPIELETTDTLRTIRLDNDIRMAEAEQQQAIANIRRMRHLSNYYLMYPEDLFTYHNYENVMNDFEQRQRQYELIHQPEAYMQPSYVRLIKLYHRTLDRF